MKTFSRTAKLISQQEVMNLPCTVRAEASEFMNMETGDIVTTVAIKEITTPSGQLLAPFTIPKEEFRELTKRVLAKTLYL